MAVAAAINGQTPASWVGYEAELGIPLAIVWRNPIPLMRTKGRLHRVRGDQFGVVYAVTDPDGTQEFRLDWHSGLN